MADDKLVDDIMRVEQCAEQVLSDRQQIVELDRRRNKTREAIRAMTKDKQDTKVWVCFGDMFLKLPKSSTKMLLQNDYDNLDKDIDEIRTNLRTKVQVLRDVEHKDELKGFGLQPLSKTELKSLEDVL